MFTHQKTVSVQTAIFLLTWIFLLIFSIEFQNKFLGETQLGILNAFHSHKKTAIFYYALLVVRSELKQ